MSRPARGCGAGLLAGAVLAAEFLAGCATAAGIPPGPPSSASGPHQVVRVVDGDTIDVRGQTGTVRVRLLGIDAPESVDPQGPVECYGPPAATYLASLLAGAQVRLERDPSQDRTDRYGRLLAYVWTAGPDGVGLVNLDLLEHGYAREYSYDRSYAYRASFRAAEARARAGERGLWSAAACAPGPPAG